MSTMTTALNDHVHGALQVSRQPRRATSRTLTSGRPLRSPMVTSEAMIWKRSGKTLTSTFMPSHWVTMDRTSP